jgi:hypothetical protein
MTAAGNEPKVLAVNPDGIPDQLKERKQWLPWAYFEGDKRSVTAAGTLAKWSDPGCRMTFEEAMSAYLNSFEEPFASEIGTFDGLQFFFSEGDGLAAIDLDHCFDEGGQVETWAKKIIAQFAGTYIELSPSGSGCHIWCLGSPRDALKYKKRWDMPKTNKREGVDSFDSSHNCCLTVTGIAPSGLDPIGEIIDCQPALDAFREKYLKQKHHQKRVTIQPTYVVGASTGDIDLDRLRDALPYVPGASYDDWYRAGIALKNGGAPFSVFHEWSQGQPGYVDHADCLRKWEHDLKPNGSKGLGSIFHTAKTNGWIQKHSYGLRPIQAKTVSELVKEIFQR